MIKTEKSITFIKRRFQDLLATNLNLTRISAPLFVAKDSGVQDNLNGNERPVSFNVNDTKYEIVHSLAKWKRLALKKYGFKEGEGIYTDMNAIRPDEPDLTTDIHSIYVDQWDWEKIISERTDDELKTYVYKVYDAIYKLSIEVNNMFETSVVLPKDIYCITSEQLLSRWPGLSSKEREDKIALEHKAVFISKIGGKLSDGSIHDGRAPDYDDWSLNGDIIVWNSILGRSFELSSMGIRVDVPTLLEQIENKGYSERLKLPWHKMLLNADLPQSIGGGIGQSRLCMFLLEKRHIGEVQVGIWNDEIIKNCEDRGIKLL